MVDWKKDIKLSDVGRRKKDDEVTPAEKSESVWKKEVSFRRRKPPVRDSGPVEGEPGNREVAPEEPAVEKTSVWKKEISFGRRKPPVRDSGPVEVPAEEPAAEQTSVWKKEISFGRRKPPVRDSGPVEVPAEEPAAEQTSVWKKEISFKRKAKAEELLVLPPLPPVEESPQPAVDLPEPVEPEQVVEAAPEREPEAAAPAALEPPPAAIPLPEPVVSLPEPVLEAAPEPEPVVEPVPPVSWVDAVLASRTPAPEPEQPAPVAAEPQAPVSYDPPAPVPVEPPTPVPAEPPAPVVAESPAPLPVEPPAPVSVDPPLAAPVEAPPLPPVVEQPPVAEADPRPIHPPVTADQLPPLDEELNVPWYKKELSFKRSRKPKAERAAAPAEKTAPFWKKELSFSRAVKPKSEPAAAAEEPTLARKPAPFWKKELSFSKKPRPNAEAAPEAAPGAPPEPEPKSSQPFWKRGLALPSLPAFSLPRPGGGGSSRGGVPKQLVGLKVGASQLAAARVSNNGHAELLQVARERIDAGIIVGGELRDPDALSEALKEFFHRHKLPKKGVRLGVANNRIGVRTFEIAGIDDPKQLANAIRFRAQEALPIPIEEAVLDYQVLEERVDGEGQKVLKILLVVAYRELVDRYAAACKKAGIQLIGIDLEAFALLRALAAPPEGGGQASAALVAVAVGHERSTFAVSDGRVCEFTRVLEWGGQNLNVAVARALDLTPSEAEPYKHALSLAGGPAPDGMTDQQAGAARDAILTQVQTFARELVSSLQFYQSQATSLGIGEIVLTGGTAHLDGFADELQRLIGVRVRIGDPLVRVKVAKRVREPEQLGSLAVAIGLGIED